MATPSSASSPCSSSSALMRRSSVPCRRRRWASRSSRALAVLLRDARARLRLWGCGVVGLWGCGVVGLWGGVVGWGYGERGLVSCGGVVWFCVGGLRLATKAAVHSKPQWSECLQPEQSTQQPGSQARPRTFLSLSPSSPALPFSSSARLSMSSTLYTSWLNGKLRHWRLCIGWWGG